jgi:hypothetical protein
MCQTCQGITIYEMFEFWYVNFESSKLKIEIYMWNVWNLKIWELKCLNWDEWILKAENWNLKIKIFMWSIWNLKIEMPKFGFVRTESWK